MAKEKNEAEKNWEKIFDEYRILDRLKKDKIFKISANDIKKYREPRLMTKFDSDKARPEIFRKNNLSILPDTRGTYVIGKFEAYSDLGYQDVKPIPVNIPAYIRTFDEFDVTSESVALNVAQMTGMVDFVLQNEDVIRFPAAATITGRLKSGPFSYSINVKDGQHGKYDFYVNNSQVEIDAGYETGDKLAIIEAKNHIPENFMVRQLYYPYRIFNNLNTDKVVMPIYFTHSDGIYAFHIFEFTELNNYSSINKVQQINFIVDHYLDISIADIMQLAKQIPIVKSNDNNVQFPQADNFNRVLDILNRVDDTITGNKVTEIYEFNRRQGNYYISALMYIGLLQKVDGSYKYELTEIGKRIKRLPNSNSRNMLIIRQLLQDECINIAFQQFIMHSDIDKDWVAKLLLDRVSTVNESTAARRAGTVISWIKWIISVSE
ncbi:type II restriction enzyme [Weissella paramesenteroides]|uniref:type II restriction enzyme n=1 Tax=Weissella paramesenteroides TaxID=1249 RepID=UPI00123A1EB2|nr:hypothetical protein [Weissella paramesenteroides]KAA8455637.1 hypothetical protein FKV86_06295 [Weissella paramesenteroides]KAA8459597.1 hypothetical protein FKV78_00405 [Weissella paramesenteroides]KAA8461042.1 hypothetical protein FKV82_00100 [Weissella paramesenteroides]KAA8462215.1 hypothetical protein FKV80_05705 [Weissella paramesenteroides]KAA8465274.1 hypothetical protein FKV83_02575 [Weissella paramesenteroides]